MAALPGWLSSLWAATRKKNWRFCTGGESLSVSATSHLSSGEAIKMPRGRRQRREERRQRCCVTGSKGSLKEIFTQRFFRLKFNAELLKIMPGSIRKWNWTQVKIEESWFLFISTILQNRSFWLIIHQVERKKKFNPESDVCWKSSFSFHLIYSN